MATVTDEQAHHATLTYLGSLDDRVHLYPGFVDTSHLPRSRPGDPGRGEAARDRELVEATLVSAALFGGPVAINDGYLLQRPGLIASVTDPDSILHFLVKHGYIKIMRRSQRGLSDIFEQAQQSGVTSIVQIPDDSRKNIAKWLVFLETLAEDCRGVMPWPHKQVDVGFVETMRSVCANRHFGVLFDNRAAVAVDRFFAAMENNTQAPRTCWERIAQQQGALGDRLMHLANAVYHINFANCMRLSGHDTRVESRFSEIFRGLVQVSEDATVRPADAPPIAITPIRVPHDANLADRNLLEAIVERGSDVARAKVRYLANVERHVRNQADAGAVKEAAREYESRIRDYIAPRRRITAKDWIIAGSQAAVSVFSVGNPLTMAAGVLVSFVSMIGPRVLRDARYCTVPKHRLEVGAQPIERRAAGMALPLGGDELSAVSARIPDYTVP